MADPDLTLTLINVPDLSPADDNFVCLQNKKLVWKRLSGLASNWFERAVKKPRISRYRAALSAVIHARASRASVVISHLPRMSAAVSFFSGLIAPEARHVAFSFNFTQLPGGLSRRWFSFVLRRVDKIFVYSSYELTLYSKYFGIRDDKFASVLWTQDAPPVVEPDEPVFHEPYLCAIGGEGRDFGCLIEAARASGLPLLVIARPHSLAGLDIPANVKVLTNIPLAKTWGLAVKSAGVVVPLLSSDTCCGQITVVSAQLLGLPLLTAPCKALAEYIDGAPGVLLYEFNSSQSLAEKMSSMLVNAQVYKDAAVLNMENAKHKYRRAVWAEAIEKCLDEFYPASPLQKGGLS